MKKKTKIEQLFEVLDKGATMIEEDQQIIYLDALAEMGDCIFQGKLTRAYSEVTEANLKKEIKKLPPLTSFQKEEIRRAMQLAILKGMKEAIKPHQTMTPDAVSIFFGYLANKILSFEKNKDAFVIFDPAVGTGNLLTAVMNQIDKKVYGIGSEPDETLIRLSYVNANLQEHEVELFHQDSIATTFLKNVDLIVSDLPVGFYPKDDVAKEYELRKEDGHSYVHHLLIEQSIRHVKDGGFLIFLIPNFLFVSDEAEKLRAYLKKEAHIYSLMQLPLSMFKSEQHAKSILVLRKKGKGYIVPKQALLVELPSFSNVSALNDIVKRISAWFDDYLK